MDKLPTEILGVILLWEVRLCRCEKNMVMPLRLVCRAFDAALRQYVFKCVQLEFSRFRKDAPAMDVGALGRIGGLAEALYLDLMVVRDEGALRVFYDEFVYFAPEFTTLSCCPVDCRVTSFPSSPHPFSYSNINNSY